MRKTVVLLMGLAATGCGGDLRAQSLDSIAAARSSYYRIEEVGGTITLSYAHGFVFIVGVVSLVALAVGILLLSRPQSGRFGRGLTFFGGLFGLVGVPAMWSERVVITPTEIRQESVFWHLGFRYSDVASIAIREVKSGRSYSRVWFITRTDGGQGEIDPGDLWDKNQDLVVDRLRRFGVRFQEGLGPPAPPANAPDRRGGLRETQPTCQAPCPTFGRGMSPDSSWILDYLKARPR